MMVVRAMGEEEEARVRMIERRWRPATRLNLAGRDAPRHERATNTLSHV